jgi:hypothetical protein
LLGVDPVAVVPVELGDGDRVPLGAELDLGLPGRHQVEVPVGVGRGAALGGEHVDGVGVVVVAQVHHRVDQARRYPGFADYEKRTAGIRTIPVLALRRR